MKKLLKELKKKKHVEINPEIMKFKKLLKEEFYTELLYVANQNLGSNDKFKNAWTYLQLENGLKDDIEYYTNLIKFLDREELGVKGSLYYQDNFNKYDGISLESEVLL